MGLGAGGGGYCFSALVLTTRLYINGYCSAYISHHRDEGLETLGEGIQPCGGSNRRGNPGNAWHVKGSCMAPRVRCGTLTATLCTIKGEGRGTFIEAPGMSNHYVKMLAPHSERAWLRHGYITREHTRGSARDQRGPRWGAWLRHGWTPSPAPSTARVNTNFSDHYVAVCYS